MNSAYVLSYMDTHAPRGPPSHSNSKPTSGTVSPLALSSLEIEYRYLQKMFMVCWISNTRYPLSTNNGRPLHYQHGMIATSTFTTMMPLASLSLTNHRSSRSAWSAVTAPQRSLVTVSSRCCLRQTYSQLRDAFVADGQQVLFVVGVVDAEPGCLVDIAHASLMHVPLDALRHDSRVAGQRRGSFAVHQVSVVLNSPLAAAAAHCLALACLARALDS